MAGTENATWLQTALKKRQIRDDAIQNYLDSSKTVQDDGALQLPRLDNVNDIMLAITSGDVTARSLSNFYIAQAIKAHQRSSTVQVKKRLISDSLTEILFEDALRRAEELDVFFQKNKRPVGPLHGVPMTLKDQFDVKGYDSTLGYVGRAFKPAAEDCVLVTLLRQMGAVIIAKSNLPQSIMWCETENPLWGLTVHPANRDFTPGGSSGGEGTLLALQGSVVGWGTDIGGSIRIPSHMLGLYGLKPSSTRLPYHGVSVSTEGQEHVPSVIGPMARNIDSLISTTRAIVEGMPWSLDPKCCPLPWRADMFVEVQARPLVVGIMYDDGVVKPHPPVSRVLGEVASKLEKAGHELVAWTPGKLHQDCIDIMDQFYTVDGGEDIRREVQLGGEPFIPHVEALVNKGKPISVYAYWQLNKQKFAAQKRFLDLWNSTVSPRTGRPIDILITPVMPHAALPHRKCRWVGYTKVFNFVDYAAVVLPAGEVSNELDSTSTAEMSSYQPRNDLDRWNWDLFSLNSMSGMPIGVQVVARRLEEEKALGAAKVIDDLVRAAQTP